MAWQTNIYSGGGAPPPPVYTYCSHYNTNDGADSNATVSNFSTTSRYISRPGTFDIGDWTPDTVQSCTRNENLFYDTGDNCSIANNSSTILTVNVFGADGVTILSSHNVTIAGDIDDTLNDIRIRVTSFGADDDKFMGRIRVYLNIENIIGDSGRFNVEIIHTNGSDGIFTKTQNDLFYDIEMLNANLTGVSIVEHPDNVVTTHISGLEYYTLGSQFEVRIADIDNLNSDSYPLIQINLIGPEYALPAIDISGHNGDIIDWSDNWDDNNDNYEKLDWTVSIPNITSITSTGNVSARTVDWSPGAYINSPDDEILVETHTTLSTMVAEYFYEESWRCSLLGNFNLPNQKGWDSTLFLGLDDACFINGGVERNTMDYRTYMPNQTSELNASQTVQPDYSSQNATVYLIREFIYDGGSSSGFTIFLNGSWDSIEWKLAKTWDGSASGGTNWINAETSYNSGTWNHGEGNCGGQIGTHTATEIHNTFGTNNPVNCSGTLYLQIGFVANQRLDSLRIEFD